MATKSSAASDAGLVNRPSLTLKRRLNAPPAKVYAAWTDPQKIAGWFGPSQVKAGSVQAEIDARSGGRFRISFSSDDEYYEVGGVYREVVPNERLVFSWAWHSTPERESLVTVSLKPMAAARCSRCTTSSSSTRPRATAMSAAGPAYSTSLKAMLPETIACRGACHATAQNRLA
jgi:uncharacterized protein YndB with AHSA1/START domain